MPVPVRSIPTGAAGITMAKAAVSIAAVQKSTMARNPLARVESFPSRSTFLR